MEVATPGGSADVFCTESEAAGARALDPGLSTAKEAAKALPPGKRPSKWKSTLYMKIKKVQHLCAEPF